MEAKDKLLHCERSTLPQHSETLCPDCDKDMEELVFDAIAGHHHRQLEPAVDADGFKTELEVALPEGGYHIVEDSPGESSELTDDDRDTAAFHMGMMGM